MKIKYFTFNPFQENTYVVYDETKECIIIDPGCYTEKERTELRRFITSEGLKPVKLINTHCHVCLLYTSPSPRDQRGSRMPSSA